MMKEPSYTIGKLAEAAETTPRTIRYYSEQGLLPAPEIRGKYSHYSERHLQRLRLIQMLKNAFLPLASIRAQMEGLTDDEVNAIVDRCSPSADKGTPTLSEVSIGLTEPVAPGNRVAYLTQVLEVSGQTLSAPQETNEKQARRLAILVSPHLKTTGQLPEPSGEMEIQLPNAASFSVGEPWERVWLAPGVEMHVRPPGTLKERQILEQRIAAAKALFETEG